MKAFEVPHFKKEIANIGDSYGGESFWPENLKLDQNPDATWRASLYLASLGDAKYADPVRKTLKSKDSRVRAWACFALGQFQDELAVEQIYRMKNDPSFRVRVHARQALQFLVDRRTSDRYFPLRVRAREKLILISDDSKTNQDYLSSVLKKLGFLVITASTEQETIDLANRAKPQAIITDNQKGRGRDNLSGLNMTWDICRQPNLRETIIFMLTADQVEPIFLWNGGDYLLHKGSSSLDDLLQVVFEFFRH